MPMTEQKPNKTTEDPEKNNETNAMLLSAV